LPVKPSTAHRRPPSFPATCRTIPAAALDGSLEGELKFVRFRPPLVNTMVRPAPLPPSRTSGSTAHWNFSLETG
jgi:hypothetical protein